MLYSHRQPQSGAVLSEIEERAGVKTLIAQPSVKTFNESVLNRRFRVDVIGFDTVIPGRKGDG